MKLGYRLLLLLALLVGGLVYLTPTLVRPVPSGWPSFLPSEPISLGLDLQGGIHLILQVEVDKAVETALDGVANDLRRELSAEQILPERLAREGATVALALRSPERADDVQTLLVDDFPSLVVASGGPGLFTLSLDEREERRIREFAIDQSLETIRNRVDQFGVREPVIQRSGSDSILIQLPGIQDPNRAKELIGKTAVLEFKLVSLNAGAPDQPAPAGTEILYGQQDRNPETGATTQRIPYTLEKKTLMTGEVIADARVRPATQLEGPYVELSLNRRGAKLFEEITGANVGRQLAIVLDGTVYSAPVIQERIGGGRASITGNFDVKEARDLAIVLRAGALPAPVTLAEERTVGPTLGQDSIEQGVRSFLVGGVIVILFILIYYRGAGLIADLALTLNVFFILAALGAFGATLTLPGIAGLVLTLGMAVDANVLINERIREELRAGKSVRAAIEAGYERALPAILDSNITTFLAGVILFQFGSGPIKGFAVTLCIGLATSVFTAVVCTRMVYDYMLGARPMKSISI